MCLRLPTYRCHSLSGVGSPQWRVPLLAGTVQVRRIVVSPVAVAVSDVILSGLPAFATAFTTSDHWPAPELYWRAGSSSTSPLA